MEIKMMKQLLPIIAGLILTACTSSAVLPVEAAQPPAAPKQFIGQQVTITPEPIRAWIDPGLPTDLKESIQPLVNTIVTDPTNANIQIGLTVEPGADLQRIYALAAPFPTIEDGIDSSELRSFWQGKGAGLAEGRPLLMAADTLNAFTAVWGEPQKSAVRVIPTDQLLQAAWDDRPAWAILPFEMLEPRWKVLRVDGISPLDWKMKVEQYPLRLGVKVTFSDPAAASLAQFKQELSKIPFTNRDPEKLTVLVMTGTTALVRTVGYKMEQNGMTYPARDIRDWLVDADLTHISNEVSFEPTCPPGNPSQKNLMFCSRPEYIELLDYIDADIIEMTGNHLADWRIDSMVKTLDMYREHGMMYYGTGLNDLEARKPLLVEDHGNRLAFIGCNPSGPPNVWAQEDRVGVARCDYPWVIEQIKALRQEGYLVIVTLQYNEHYAIVSTPYQQRDFPPLAQAGAVIVQGSQAHHPVTMDFVDGNFVHYGLGNLFFDQMDQPVKGTRREFLDRHVFYDGKYLGVELLTAMLEDYSKPRPMTEEERKLLLEDAFRAAKWLR